MSLIKKFFGFLKSIFLCFSKSSVENESPMPIEKEPEEDILKEFSEEIASVENEDKVSAARRTLMTKLYILEQEVAVFENSFPKEYQAFMEKIECLRETYNSTLEEMSKRLTFEIDPELDWGKSGEVLKLEREIQKFVDKEVKFDSISKSLQRFITKLNILYNVSIFHSEEYEKEKVLSQLEHALKSAIAIARDFKECEYILEDKQLKERIVSLISYIDYEIFKASIRNSNESPDKLIKNLVMISEFDGFDYTSIFNAFIKDELTDLGGLLTLISDERCCRVLRKKLINLLTSLTYSNNTENQLVDSIFWNNFLKLESCLLETLKVDGVEKEKVKVGLIIRMDISIDESEVVVLPITNAFLSLTSIYSRTQDTRILLVIKLLKNVSNDITYKEIYFLLLLFDAIGVLKNTSNELIRHVEKYIEKYPYNSKTIIERKRNVINSSNKEYVVVFTLDDYEEEITTTLQKLNIDFKVIDKKVFVNSFYFNGLESVLRSLQNNTNNTTV